MSQIYAPTRQGKIRMFREARARALQQGDMGMVRNCDIELAACGYETTQADRLEDTMAPKPRRGRQPMPRCEHDVIIPRCEVCYPEEAV
jgi:hypothetical protein